ncbi:hypothetical protein K2X30_06435 [bacterium]|jgi:hypothetical protein|nr:hypothetical protein [bacterium]
MMLEEKTLFKKKYYVMFVLQFAALLFATRNWMLSFFTTLPMTASCAWMIEFGDEIGARTGYWSRGFRWIDQPTPGIFVKGFGWLGYLLMLVIPFLKLLKKHSL